MPEITEEKKYKYDAFISYRHCQPDQFVAENLHKQLEAFSLPGNVVKKLKKDNPNAKTKISRVFRDQDELPLASNLADPIVEALKESEWLIVICSPRLKESMWCRKEIDTFISLHGRDRVMAVLVEGEPSDSFPEELLHRKVEKIKPDGSKEIIDELVEPLAADVRGNTDQERVNAIKSEMLRLLAPMFNLSYDELKQRHRERRLRRMLTAAVVVAIVSILFGLLSTFSALTINHQKNEIKKQSDVIAQNASQIEEQAEEINSQNEVLKLQQAKNLAMDSQGLMALDDRYGAVKLAYEALTEYDGIEMPYTDEARYALTTALKPYSIDNTNRAIYSIEMDGVVSYLLMSPERKYLAIYDSSQNISIFDVEKREIKDKVLCPNVNFETNDIDFKDDTILYYSDSKSIHEYNTETGEDKAVIDGSYLLKVRYCADNNRVYVIDDDKIVAYDANTYKEVFSYAYRDDFMSNEHFTLLKDGKVVAANETDDGLYVDVLDNDGEVIFTNVYEDVIYSTAYQYEDKLFIWNETDILANMSFGNLYNYLYAYSLETGKLLWERKDVDLMGDTLFEIEEEDGIYLVGIGDAGVAEYDINTGDESLLSKSSGTILWKGGTDTYALYITDEPQVLFVAGHSSYGYGNVIECNLPKVKVLEFAGDGYFAAGANSSRVIYYSELSYGMLDEYNEELNNKESETLDCDFNRDEIEEIGLNNPEIISAVTYDYDHKYMCVSGKDGVARLYKAEGNELLSTWEMDNVSYKIREYLGEDKEGNTYWASDMCGYCLSPDYQLIGRIDYLRSVDKDQYIFGSKYGSSEYYSAPIYDLDDLLKMAKDYIENK